MSESTVTEQIIMTFNESETPLPKTCNSNGDNDDDDFDYDESVFQNQNIVVAHNSIIKQVTTVSQSKDEYKPKDTSYDFNQVVTDPLSSQDDIKDTTLVQSTPFLDLTCDVKEESITTASEGTTDEFTEAQNEWNNVEEIVAKPSGEENTSQILSKLITFNEALELFSTVDLNDYADKIRPCIKHSGVASIFNSIFGPPKLTKSLHQERNLIFTLAVVMFNNSEVKHFEILKTIYKKLTRSRFDCSRYGSHWEEIGFQGDDPTTDLRGCGMLGLLTTLHFVISVKTCKLSYLVYQLSQDQVQNFPFCVMSINVTRITLQVLREGELNKECNRRLKERSQKYRNEFDNIVLDVFLELYVAIFYRIYRIWKTEHKTIAESGFVIKDVEQFAKKKPVEVIKDLMEYLSGSKSNEEAKIDSFIGIENLDKQ